MPTDSLMLDNAVPSATALRDETYVEIACHLPPCPTYACAHIIAELQAAECERDALRERERRLRAGIAQVIRRLELVTDATDVHDLASYVQNDLAELLAAKEGGDAV